MDKTAVTFDDVLLVPRYNPLESRRSVSTSVTDQTGKLNLDLPILTANMDTVTGHEMASFISSRGGAGVLHRFMSIEDNVYEYKKSPQKTFVSVGTSGNEVERFATLLVAGATYFCVDVAHGHAKYVKDMIKTMRSMAGNNICIMAGNVATLEGAEFLADAGADIIKVGIGPGSVCTTRIKTGFGVPQLSAVQECSRVNRSIVADGGIRTPGDIVKALAFGADFVMVGGMLAGTEPTPGYTVEVDGKTMKEYRGMASKEAQEFFGAEMPKWKTDEGVSTFVTYRDDQDQIIDDIVGGIRSGLTYGGASNIKELQKNMRYSLISSSGKIESLPHKTMK